MMVSSAISSLRDRGLLWGANPGGVGGVLLARPRPFPGSPPWPHLQAAGRSAYVCRLDPLTGIRVETRVRRSEVRERRQERLVVLVDSVTERYRIANQEPGHDLELDVDDVVGEPATFGNPALSPPITPKRSVTSTAEFPG